MLYVCYICPFIPHIYVLLQDTRQSMLIWFTPYLWMSCELLFFSPPRQLCDFPCSKTLSCFEIELSPKHPYFEEKLKKKSRRMKKQNVNVILSTARFLPDEIFHTCHKESYGSHTQRLTNVFPVKTHKAAPLSQVVVLMFFWMDWS